MAVKDFLNRLMERFPDMEMMPLSSQEIEAIVAAHPELPREYIDWLTAFGWGVIGNEEYIFHGGPVDPGEFLDPEQADKLHDFVVIGEDAYGNFLGYRRGVLGEVSASGSWQSLKGTTLIDFLFQRLLTSTSCHRDVEDTGHTGTKDIYIINETESDITIQYAGECKIVQPGSNITMTMPIPSKLTIDNEITLKPTEDGTFEVNDPNSRLSGIGVHAKYGGPDSVDFACTIVPEGEGDW